MEVRQALFFFFGRMLFGVLMLGVILALVIVFFIWSRVRRMKRYARANSETVEGKAYTSTGSTSQRYRDQQANSRYSSRSYSGPTARRSHTYSSANSSASSNTSDEPIEIPLLEVVDVPEDK